MGIITEISSQKNKKRVNIFVDGEFVSGLSFECAVKNGLKTGKEIDGTELERIIEESETSSAFEAGLLLISRSAKTEKEVKAKLISKGFSEKVIAGAINKLKEYRYINDAAFSQSFVRSYASKSRREIENKLRQKGVSHDDIQEALSLVDDGTEREKAVHYAEKYMKNKVMNEKTKNNLFAGLARKGFALDIIYGVIEDIKKEREE